MIFETLNLHPKILKAIHDAGYTTPTPIQEKAIPVVLEGADIRASAQTGTGKTAAFLLPALNRLVTPAEKNGKGPRVLILAPTRELAMQIGVQAEKYSKHLERCKTVCIGGGVPYHKQLSKLSRPYDILIATPGRLIDFLHQGKIAFPRLEMLVVDEADRMLDMGFVEPVEEIVAATPGDRQTLLFSATLQGSVLKLSERLLKNPVDIKVHAEKAKHENIEQRLHYVDDLYHKNRLLDHILNDDSLRSAIVFTSTKRHADQLVDDLYEKGHLAKALHGDMSQRHRTRTIQDLRKGKFNVLVATDVAARGIDVQSITHVINFDLPRNIEDYVHRIGRTGRAGTMGIALSFAAGKDSDLVRRIEKFTGQPINVSVIPGMEPTKKSSSSSPRNGPGGKRGSFGKKRSPSFGPRKSSFGKWKSSYGENSSSIGENKRTFRKGKSSSGEKSTSFGEGKNSFGPKKSSFGKKKSSFGSPKNSFGAKKRAPKRRQESRPRKGWV